MVPVVPAIMPELEPAEAPDAAPVDVPDVVDVAVGQEALDGGVLEDAEPDLDRLEREKKVAITMVVTFIFLASLWLVCYSTPCLVGLQKSCDIFCVNF